MSVTVHYLNCNFKIVNYTLNITVLPESHTSENINTYLRQTLNEWGFNNDNYDIYFITDNAANITKAIRLCDAWQRIPYFAHTLQLVVKDSVRQRDHLSDILKKCKTIVNFFHRSSSAQATLKAEQITCYPDRKPLKLINDIDTRWNSQYDMLHRLLEVRRALTVVLCEPRMPGGISTVMLTAEKKPTLSRYFPAIYGIRHNITNIISSENCQYTTFFTNNLLSQLDNTFRFIENEKHFVVSMIMDPTIKSVCHEVLRRT